MLFSNVPISTPTQALGRLSEFPCVSGDSYHHGVRLPWPLKTKAPDKKDLLASPPHLLFLQWLYVPNPVLCAWVKRKEQYWKLSCRLFGQAKLQTLCLRATEITSSFFSLYNHGIPVWDVGSAESFSCCSILCNLVEEDFCVCWDKMMPVKALSNKCSLCVYCGLWFSQLRGSRGKGEFLHLSTVKQVIFFFCFFMWILAHFCICVDTDLWQNSWFWSASISIQKVWEEWKFHFGFWCGLHWICLYRLDNWKGSLFKHFISRTNK